MFYIIAYDITENHLRNKVSRILSGFGKRIQKSVFELDLRPEKLAYVMNMVAKCVADGDSLRCYPLCERCVETAQSYNKSPLARDKPYYFV